jgi:hypothetical protein
MSWLVTADLHLDDKPHHSYRWGLFDWLAKQKAGGYLILGDLTDEKDNHSATLVNKLVASIEKLRDRGDVYILMGNHDYVDPKYPFFDFLNHMDNVTYLREAREIYVRIAAIPHQPDQKSFDEACRIVYEDIGEPVSMVLLHGLFEGAVGDTGARLTGLRPALVEKFNAPLVLAGDVHRPQQVGPVTYVGAPYRVRFGDDYIPRVLRVDNGGNLSDLHYPCPRKHSVTIDYAHNPEDIWSELKFQRGDQVKITLALPNEEVVEWAKHKKAVMDVCRGLGLEVFGIQLKLPETRRKPEKQVAAHTTIETFENFCRAENITEEIREAGREFMGDKNV